MAPQSPTATDATTNASVELSTAAGVPTYATWDEVIAAAEGTTVNWYMWGGSDTINAHVDAQVGGPLLEEYGVTLNRASRWRIPPMPSTRCSMRRPPVRTMVAAST
ncbi:MAG: hypothetical protein R2932_07485 [Caldilineaceae bacterium]